MPFENTFNDGRSNSAGGGPNDSGLGFSPADDWLSPFSGEFERSSYKLFGQLEIKYFRPKGWKEIQSPVEDTRQLLIAPDENATFVFGAGVLPDGISKVIAIAQIAASPVAILTQNGVQIPLAMSIPVKTDIDLVEAAHMLNFPATVPGHLVNSSKPTVPMFKYTTVLAIANYWISIETTSWGEGCDPSVEIGFMGKLHCNMEIERL